MVYAGNQWISFDDAQSFRDKKAFLSKRCLGGLMVRYDLSDAFHSKAN
jgi:chitinase